MHLSAEDRFNIELIKLLLQVAWSDRAVSQRESQVILGLGRSWSVPEEELQSLLRKLEAGNGLPEPDLAVLRERPDDVLTAARALAASDFKMGDGEKQLLSELEARLSR